MKKLRFLYYILLSFIISNIFKLNIFAEDAGGIFGTTNDTGLTLTNVKKGEIHIDNIPSILKYVIDLLLGVSGTIAVIFIIIGAYKILFGSLTSEKTEGKNTIIMALTGFVIATLAWFIVKFIINNFA